MIPIASGLIMLHYFDHNATTPLLPAARAAWLQAADENWMNPSSPYRHAAAVRVRLEAARESLADRFGANRDRLIFTSGATESNNAVFAHVARRCPYGKVAVCTTEHPSVIEAARFHFEDRVVWLPVDHEGVVDMAALERAMATDNLALVSVMAANNETGVIQPWAEIAALCLNAGIKYHCDASQWVGKMPLDGLSSGSYISGCGHKFGGPKGVGFLLVSSPNESCVLQMGGSQESGRRGGTEDVPGILSMVAALTAARPQPGTARDAFLAELSQQMPDMRILGAGADRLWNTASIILPEFPSVRWVRALERQGFLISSGSACATGKSGASHVLAAMGVTPAAAERVIRISSGFETKAVDWADLAGAIMEAYEVLKNDAATSTGRVISID